MWLGAGYVPFNFSVSRDDNLALGKHVHGGLGFDLVAGLGFLSVQRL
jgi:hypothetical protein